MTNGKGWYNDIPQHILASKGIETSFENIRNRNDKRKIPEEVYKNGINSIKLDFFLNNIAKFYGNKIGDAGNCGVFAVALKNFLEEKFEMDVDLIGVIGEYEPEYFYHVAIRWNGNYYDIDGKQNEVKLERRGKPIEHPDARVDIIPIDETSALKRTEGITGSSEYKVEEMKEMFSEEWKIMEGELS